MEVIIVIIETNYTNNIFKNIKHVDECGNEYWFARDLSKVLEYKDWRNFLKDRKSTRLNSSHPSSSRMPSSA